MTGLDAPGSAFVLPEVVVLEGPAPALADPHALIPVLRDLVASQHRVAALFDLHTDERVPEDLVLLQRSLHPLALDHVTKAFCHSTE